MENSPLYGCVLLEGPSSSPPTTDTQSRGTETSPSPTPLPPQQVTYGRHQMLPSRILLSGWWFKVAGTVEKLRRAANTVQQLQTKVPSTTDVQWLVVVVLSMELFQPDGWLWLQLPACPGPWLLLKAWIYTNSVNYMLLFQNIYSLLKPDRMGFLLLSIKTITHTEDKKRINHGIYKHEVMPPLRHKILGCIWQACRG